MTLLDEARFADLELGPDLDVIARQVVAGKRRLKRPAPSVVDLATAITSLSITDTMKGSSTLTVSVADPDWELLDSGFFDNDSDGKLDAIDVNYPDGSRLWWRITQVSPSSDQRIELTLMERSAVFLMAHKGPVKTSRAKKTRAEFLKMLADKVKAGGGIAFYSKELHKKQPTVADPKPKQEDDRKTRKDGGINSGEKLKIKGAKATKDQLKQAETALDVAADLKASDLATLAMVCAGIGESSFKAVMNAAGSDYGGVFQGNVKGGVFDINDTTGMAKCFLKGGKGFQGGGAMAIANAHPDWGPGHIAVTVEGSRSNFGSDSAAEHYYGQYEDEAKKIIDAYGGTGFGGTTYRQQYNFEVGSAEEPNETYWDAMNRLAEEVNWALFLDGSRMYFDAETTLIKQKPVAVIHRDDPAVINWSGDWDARHIATEMTLEIICDPFEFRAGEVFKLEDFGPFSTGTTAKLPGRWLISEISRERSSLSSTFTLKQPAKPNREPASEITQREGDSSTQSGEGASAAYEEAKRISDENLPYVWGGGHASAGRKDRGAGSDKGIGFDCSGYVAACLVAGGYFKKGASVPRSDQLGAMYADGKGDELTVYSNAEHVFLVFEKEDDRADTSPHAGDRPSSSGPHVRGKRRDTSGFRATDPTRKHGAKKGGGASPADFDEVAALAEQAAHGR